MDLGHQIVCLFVFESCLIAPERIAEWIVAAIHRPNLLAHVGDRGKGHYLLLHTGTTMAGDLSWGRRQQG